MKYSLVAKCLVFGTAEQLAPRATSYRFAYLGIRTVLALVLFLFDMELCQESYERAKK
jgi:hypothetical protein